MHKQKKVLTHFSAGLIFIFSIINPVISKSESQPDSGNIMRDMEKTREIPKEKSHEVVKTPESLPAPEDTGPTVLVRGFRITGTTIFNKKELAELLAEYLNKNLSFAELQKPKDKIAAYYISHGYIAGVYLPPQEIKDGVVEINVVEGRLQDVIPDAESKFPIDFERAKKYITSVHGVGAPVNINKLETGMLLLNDLPGTEAASVLEAGAKPSEIRQIVNLTPRALVSGSLELDNFGIRSAGEYRAGLNLAVNNMTGTGDQLTLKGLYTIDNDWAERSKYGKLSYSIPIGYRGLRAGLSASAMDYNLGENFSSLDAEGKSSTMGVFASYPLIRSRTRNLYLSLNYDRKDFRDESLGSTISDKELDVTMLKVNMDMFDSLMGGGYTSAIISFTSGDLDLGGNNASLVSDQAGPKTNGYYEKIYAALSRIQRLDAKTTLNLYYTTQLAMKNLDSSEEFSLGGPYGVRAYPVNEASGDEGYVFNAEIHRLLIEKLTLFCFYDYGRIKVNYDRWAGASSTIPNAYRLEGAGGGFLWQITKGTVARGTVASRIGNNPAESTTGDDSDGRKRDPRFWMSVSHSF